MYTTYFIILFWFKVRQAVNLDASKKAYKSDFAWYLEVRYVKC